MPDEIKDTLEPQLFSFERNREVAIEASVSRALDESKIPVDNSRAELVRAAIVALKSDPTISISVSDSGRTHIRKNGEIIPMTQAVQDAALSSGLLHGPVLSAAIEAGLMPKSKADLDSGASAKYIAKRGYQAFVDLPLKRTPQRIGPPRAMDDFTDDAEKIKFISENGYEKWAALPSESKK